MCLHAFFVFISVNKIGWNSNHREHQRDVGWHQDGNGTSAEQDGPPQILHWGSHHRQGAADGEMGGTLLRPLLQTERGDICSP